MPGNPAPNPKFMDGTPQSQFHLLCKRIPWRARTGFHPELFLRDWVKPRCFGPRFTHPDAATVLATVRRSANPTKTPFIRGPRRCAVCAATPGTGEQLSGRTRQYLPVQWDEDISFSVNT